MNWLLIEKLSQKGLDYSVVITFSVTPKPLLFCPLLFNSILLFICETTRPAQEKGCSVGRQLLVGSSEQGSKVAVIPPTAGGNNSIFDLN
jgi:hypothetical protein